jgi:hypothetical protein
LKTRGFCANISAGLARRRLAIFRWLKIFYYRLAARYAAWTESAREAYVNHAVSSLGVRTLLTAGGFNVTWPGAAGGDGLTLEFIVRVSSRRFPRGDDRYFVEAFFSRNDIALRVDGRPADITAVELERTGWERYYNFWLITITAVAPTPAIRTGTEIVLETAGATATFMLGTVTDETVPYQAPGVREFVRRLRPGDFDD